MANRISVVVNGTPYDVEVVSRTRDQVRFKLGGREYAAEFQSSVSDKVDASPSQGTKTREQKDLHSAARSANADEVVAPMPGVVAALNVAAGASVKSGDVLLTIEAMKMQNKIFAPRAATIRRIAVVVGEEVRDGQPLIEFEPQKTK